MKWMISDHKVSEIKICLTTLEIDLIYKTLWLKKFLINDVIKFLTNRNDKRGHVDTKKQAAAAIQPPSFSPRWDLSQINLNSQLSSSN